MQPESKYLNNILMSIRYLLLPAFMIALALPLQSQERRTMTFDASSSLMLPEFSALLTINGNGALQVEMKMGQHNSDASLMNDQLERGDLILMMNGARVSDIAEMRKQYEGIAEGDEIKIGVRRGVERFILTKIKGDVPEGAQSGGMRMVMNMDTDGPPPIIVPELGLLLADSDSGITIARLLEPLLPAELQATEIAGFTIVSINGQTFENAEELKTFISNIEVGATLDLTLQKDGNEKTISLKKPESRANLSISVD